MTRNAWIAAGVAALLIPGRSYWVPSRAPTWLRGASPFTWTETRAERDRCLAFEGDVMRGKYLNYVFRCATANVRGHPGEHRSEIAEPWPDATEWSTVHATEERLTQSCADSAAVYFPTSRFSRHTVMLRSLPFRGRLLMMAIDTAYDTAPRELVCSVAIDAAGRDFVSVPDPNAPF